ncbi:MAG: hypothetical protein JNM94_07550 [Phycisphaerae bacterium]|nr:hypothetical protein [Phycisphaerae bacterium]
MTTSELRDIATVVAASVALLVFIVNSLSARRTRRIENLARFIESHERLFDPDGYISRNIVALNDGTLVRDASNAEMEARFHRMLIEIERFAILANNEAVPRLTQVYMFGWYTKAILRLLSKEERSNMSWELAINYLEKLAEDTERYRKLSFEERQRFWQ